MKPSQTASVEQEVIVAPHAGAWIETDFVDDIISYADVAPHAGAWIETVYYPSMIDHYMSHPTRVRGLKHKRHMDLTDAYAVAPSAGAWIETLK